MTLDPSRRLLEPLLTNPPLNLLGLAAGAAEPGGSVDAETVALMAQQVAAGALSGTDPAALWPLLVRGLLGEQPSRMLTVLRDCGALERLLPEVAALFGHQQSADDGDLVDIGVHQWRVVDGAARGGSSLAVRFAALVFNLGKPDSPVQHLPSHYRHVDRCLPRIAAIGTRFGVPAEVLDFAVLVAAELERVHRAAPMRAASLVALLERVDAFGQPARFRDLLTVCACDYGAYGGNAGRPYGKALLLERALEACRGLSGQGEVRAEAVARALGSERWAAEDVA